MNNQETAPVKTKIYFLGGCGMNIGSVIGNAFPGVDIQYIDSSDANVGDQVDQSKLFRVPGMRGAGSNRRLAYAKAKPHIEPLIAKADPCDFNIVVFSLSGGTGSAICQLVVGGLLAKEETVVAIGIGSADNGNAIQHTIDTLKTLEATSSVHRAPIILSYHENASGIPFGQVDDEVFEAITYLVQLSNQDNHGLDVQDVHNWANYHKITPLQPSLTALVIHHSRQEAATVMEPLTVLSLYNDRDKANPFGSPYHSKIAYPRDLSAGLADQTHFITTNKAIEDYFRDLTDKQTSMNRQFNSFRSRQTLVDADDAIGSDGFVG